jgi:hypothetical protein
MWVRVVSAGLGADVDFAASIEPVARHLLGEPNKALSNAAQEAVEKRAARGVAA